MADIKTAAEEFLGLHRIAVTGVSRSPSGHGSNTVYRRLKSRGYDVVAINPSTDRVEGDPSYPDLASVPGDPIQGVVIATRPERAMATVRECADLGISRVWMHRLSGEGSVSAAATFYGHEHGLTVIEGGCPLMFGPTSDVGHRVLCWFAQRRGDVPREVR